METALVIMAAGMGSRYGGLKQMEGFGPGGETLLEYSLYDALRSGFGQAVFILREEMEGLFREKVMSRFADRIACRLIFQRLALGGEDAALVGAMPERTKPWGTGHALKTAVEAVSGPFLLINADDFYGKDAFATAGRFLRAAPFQRPQFGLVAYRLDRTLSAHGTVSRGVLTLDPQGRLRQIEEHHRIEQKPDGVEGIQARTGSHCRLDPSTPVSMNLLAFNPEIRGAIKAAWTAFLKTEGRRPEAEFGIPDVLNRVLQRPGEEVTVLRTEERWMGVTHPEDAALVRRGLAERVAQGDYPEWLWSS